MPPETNSLVCTDVMIDAGDGKKKHITYITIKVVDVKKTIQNE